MNSQKQFYTKLYSSCKTKLDTSEATAFFENPNLPKLSSEARARLQNTPQLKLFGAATENGYAVGASTRYSKGLGMSYLYSADKSSNYFKVFLSLVDSL